MQDFRRLAVWHKAHALTLAIYQLTNHFPPDERFGLISQMRRSSASISTNIAEGCGRSGNPELVRFLRYSTGSASELEYQLLLSKDLNYLSEAKHNQLHQQTIEVKKMLGSLITKLNRSKTKLKY